jgi:predicted O-methyltransferase YrrM
VDYVRDLFAPEPEALKTLTVAAHAAGMPVDWEISPDVGRLFQLLARSVGAKRVLEFGTFAGHSAYWFASVLPAGGKVVSVEINPTYAEFARENLVQRGVGEKVEIRLGACREMLPDLEREVQETGERYDVLFLDTEKAYYPELFAWSVKILRPGGLLLADNVLRSGSWRGQSLLDPDADEPRIIAIREFNRRLAEHPQFTSLIIPMRAGVAVGLYQP